MVAWWSMIYDVQQPNELEGGGLLEGLLETFLRGIRRLLRGRGRGSSNGGSALRRRRLGHIFVERGLENLDRLGEGLAGTDQALGIPSLHAEYEELCIPTTK